MGVPSVTSVGIWRSGLNTSRNAAVYTSITRSSTATPSSSETTRAIRANGLVGPLYRIAGMGLMRFRRGGRQFTAMAARAAVLPRNGASASRTAFASSTAPGVECTQMHSARIGMSLR